MSSQRSCKRGGRAYGLLVPYSRARKDIRDFCPACVPFVLDGERPTEKTAQIAGMDTGGIS